MWREAKRGGHGRLVPGWDVRKTQKGETEGKYCPQISQIFMDY